MTEPTSTDSNDPFLAEFLRELERATDREAVVRKYAALRPELTHELRDLASVQGQLRGALEAENEPRMPEWLGEFRLLRCIARGGMGEIYEAEQRSLVGRKVAVKVIRHGRLAPEARTRFLREQAVLARLHQTHIVPVYTAGEHDLLQYFAMPYINGAALNHVVASAGAWTQQPDGKSLTLKELATRIAQSRAPAAPLDAEANRQLATRSERGPASATSTEASLPRALRVSLPAEYFRSVAEVMADAAEALHHAHSAGFVHRDVKPSNIMVDGQGKCWIIDFGLTGYLDGLAEPALRQELAHLEAETKTLSGQLGTLPYMAPEQLHGKAEVRSDVWGLGATLYELCTLRRPFEATNRATLVEQIVRQEPERPRRLGPNVPRDLEAICRRALQKEPDQRYPSAQAFADDLRRWLRNEPTAARPARLPRRLWLWCVRNPGWAAALVVGVLAVLGLGTAEISAQSAQRVAAEGRSREQRREALLQEILRRQLMERTTASPGDLWAKIVEAARIRTGPDLRDVAAATLIAPHGTKQKTFQPPSPFIAFDPTGRFLARGGQPTRPAIVWDADTDEERPSGLEGAGPVAFTATGVPLQLVVRSSASLWLWDVDRKKRLQELTFPAEEQARPGTIDPQTLVLAPTTRGTLVAACRRQESGRAVVVVWDGQTGKVLRRANLAATALAVTPDGSLLAVGTETGTILLMSLRHDETVTLGVETLPVTALAFGRNGLRGDSDEPNWLLASGDEGGLIAVWDVARRQPRAYCRGGRMRVYGLAFRSDGVLLASCHHDWTTRLWDSLSGESVLQEVAMATGLAFAPNGRRLAAGAGRADGRIDVWELGFGCGVTRLRGLPGQAARLAYSPDGRLLAALASNWRVAIWGVPDGRLQHVLEVDPGLFPDNAGMAFSADGKQFAFSAGSNAAVWNLTDGKRKRRWQLPRGLQDQLGFHGDKLLLFRYDCLEKNGPGHCRLRNLFAADPTAVLPMPDELNADIFLAAGSLDGSVFVADGRHRRGEELERRVCAFDGLTGKLLWKTRTENTAKSGVLEIDPVGTRLVFEYDCQASDKSHRTAELRSGEIVSGRGTIRPLSPHGRYEGGLTPQGFALYHGDAATPLVDLGIRGAVGPGAAQFSPDGKTVAWAAADGGVILCDIQEVRRRLSAVNLGW